jgi:hypothetical protein
VFACAIGFGLSPNLRHQRNQRPAHGTPGQVSGKVCFVLGFGQLPSANCGFPAARFLVWWFEVGSCFG